MTVSAPVALRRLKYVATLNDQALGEDTDPDFEMAYIDISNVDSSGRIQNPLSMRFSDAPSRARRLVVNGDVIVSTVRTYLQAIAHIADPPQNLVVSTGFAVVRPRHHEFTPDFCRYALREVNFLAEVQKLSVGVSYPAINASDLGDIFIPVPTLPKQRAIADYLDRETARIDALIAAKQRLLDLIAEKRKALITQAVTQGLDPNVPKKPSGIPWLGDIPADWEVTRLKFIADVRGGLTLGKLYATPDVIEYPYLRVANVQDGFLDLEDVRTVAIPEREAGLYLLQEGDVLMNEGGDADKLGRGAVWRGEIEPCIHQNHVFAVRPRKPISDWLATYTQSEFCKSYFESSAKQSTNLASISASNLRELPVLLPPNQEMLEILTAIGLGTQRLDWLKEEASNTISLLQERRSALIAAAVTGQIPIPSESEP